MEQHTSHHHLLAFAALALAVTMVFSSRVIAEEMKGPPPDQNRGGDQRGGGQPNEGGQPGGQPDFNRGNGDGQDQNRGNGMMGPNQPGQMMNDRPDNNRNENNRDQFGDQKNFGNSDFGNPMNGKEVRGFNDKEQKFGMPNSKNDFNRGMDNRPMNNFGEDNPEKKQFDTRDMMNSEDKQNGTESEDQEDQDDQNDQDKEREQQMVRSVQQQLKNIEQQIKQFDKQIAAVTKQKMTVPSEITASLAKVKSIIAGVKSAKTADDLEAAGWDDIRDEMSTLYEGQKVLQQLAQWPKMLKQIDKQIASAVRDLKKSKSLTDKLKKKEVDVSSTYAELETAVNSLKATRDEASAKALAGEIEEAFDILEDKLYDAFEIIKENQMILQTMSNVGRFTSDFKKAQKEIGRMISNLKRQKINTTDLERIEASINQKGQAVRQLITARPIDMDAIMDALEELSDLRQEFFDKVQSLGGGSNESNFGANQTGQPMSN